MEQNQTYGTRSLGEIMVLLGTIKDSGTAHGMEFQEQLIICFIKKIISFP